MRDVVLSLLIPGALLWGLFSASGSVLVLNWMWFQRPYDFSWGLWSGLPLFMIALVIAIVSNVLRGSFRPRLTPLLAVYLLFLVWVTLSAAFAYDTDHAWSFYRIFVASMWLGPLVVMSTVHDLKLLKLVFWVAVGSVAINGAKAGLSLALSGGGHIESQINGFVGDNNVFGVVLCMVVPMLIGLRSSLPSRKWIRYGIWMIILLCLLCIVFTRSRGAYVALGATFLFSSLLGPKPIRHSLAVITVALVGYMVLPEENFERLSTISNYQEDISALGRIENWRLAWDAALSHPLLGVGLDNHILYNRQVVQPDVQVRVAHSVYFQVLGELGFPGLMLYLAFLAGGFVSLFRTWRLARTGLQGHDDLRWVENVAFWTLGAVVAYVVGAAFLNTLYIQFPWMMVFYGSMLGPYLRATLAARRKSARALLSADGESQGMDDRGSAVAVQL